MSIFGTALQEMPTTTITTTNTSCKYLQPCTMEILISREFVNSHFRFNFFLVCSHNSHHRVKRFSLVVLMTNYKLFRQYALFLLLLLTKMFAFFSFFHMNSLPTRPNVLTWNWPQSPPKGATIPYRPKPQMNTPVLLANGQAYTIQGSYVPAQEVCIPFGECLFFSYFFFLQIL